MVNSIEPTLTITHTAKDPNNKAKLFLLGNQATLGGVKGTVIDVSSMPPPSLCSSTTVTTVFQQPIMSPAIPPLCLDQLPHPMAKAAQEEEEVSWSFIKNTPSQISPQYRERFGWFPFSYCNLSSFIMSYVAQQLLFYFYLKEGACSWCFNLFVFVCRWK